MHYSCYYRYCCYYYIGNSNLKRNRLIQQKGYFISKLFNQQNIQHLPVVHHRTIVGSMTMSSSSTTTTTTKNDNNIALNDNDNNDTIINELTRAFHENTISSGTEQQQKREQDEKKNYEQQPKQEDNKSDNNDLTQKLSTIVLNDVILNDESKNNNNKNDNNETSQQQEEQKEIPLTVQPLSNSNNIKESSSPSLSLLWDDNTISDTIKQIAIWILNDTISNIIVVCGAGISVNAGIPDFRTPGTGLYDNLSKYNLPYAEAIFDIDYYNVHPIPFIQLAKHIWPNRCATTSPTPTLTHTFLYLLQKHHKLLRIYTQNIDGLEYLAGINETNIIECHGHFRTASCINCKTPATDIKIIQNTICIDEQVPLCPICQKQQSKQQQNKHNKNKGNNNNNNNNNGYIKPDIVFFGESLPERFHNYIRNDIKNTDCCMILGTSLQVAPVSSIPNMVSSSTKRILFNREYVGNLKINKQHNNKITSLNKNKMDHNNTIRDLFHSGDCDESIMILCDLLGWKDELIYEHDKVTKLLRQNKNSSK